MKIFFLILLLFFFNATNILGQQDGMDSAEKNIAQLPDDTAKVNRMNDLAGKLQFANPAKAIAVLKSAIAIAGKINYPLGASVAYGMQANLLFYEMKLDSAKFLIDKAFTLVKNNKDILYRNQAAQLINMYGSILQQKQQYDSAVEKYLEAAKIYNETGNEAKAIYSWYNLSVMYGFLQDTVKALYYARETHKIALKENDSTFIVRSLIVLSEAFLAINKYDSAAALSQKGLAMATDQNVPFAIGKFHEMLGTCDMESSNNPGTAIAHFNVALQHFNEINIPYDVCRVLHKIGNAYLKAKDYPNAVKYLTQAITLAKELKLDQLLQYSLLDIVQAEEKQGHINESLVYLKEYVAVNDSLQSRNNRKMVNELETKYQTGKKEAQLLVQQATIQRKNMWNYIWAGSVLALIIISTLGYANYRHKQKLQQQRIAELEIQHQLTATEAVLKGEEQERTRLAKDLHDGLGGMLSGIKYSFNTMKGNLVMTESNAQAFERSMDMLDSSIKEMRRVAHNMMPEALVKFGLDTALKDFCNDINNMGALRVSYQSLGLQEVSIPQIISITIYRIVQELTHNIIKHAAAKTALVQVTNNNNNKIAITVEDDGKGFDTAILNQSKGMGWNNIKSRVDFLKGILDVQSGNTKGTSVHIEINI